MSIDTLTPRSRRAVLFGAIGGALASMAALARPTTTRAGTDGDLVLEAVNTTDAQTELQATTSGAGLRVLSDGIGLQGWGDIGVDAYGTTIGLNAIGDAAAAPAAVAYNRANGTGVFGWTTDGTDTPPAMPAKTGAYGLSEEDDPAAAGVRGKATTGVGVRGDAGTGTGVRGEASNGAGVIGVGPLGLVPDPIDWKAGVYGAAAAHPGVYGHGSTAPGVRGSSDSGDGLYGDTAASGDHPSHSPGAGVHGHGGFAGVLGTGESSFGVFAQSDTVPALYALNNSATVAAIVAEGDPGTAIHGHANAGGANQVNIPPSPPLTGVYGSATAAGVGVRGQATAGVGVEAIATSGVALAVTGRATFSRSGRVAIPANASFVDVTVPGGLAASAYVIGTLQNYRAGVHLAGIRTNYPSAGKFRIYLNQVGSTVWTTPVAWLVIG